jgi:hypothetical protein
MTGMATWKYQRERTVFILCGATGLRIGEALGLEIGKHVSSDFQTLTIAQKIRHCKVEERLKTSSAFREVDLPLAIAAMLKEFVGDPEGRILILYREREASIVVVHTATAPALGIEANELCESIYRHTQGRKSCLSSIPKHLLTELYRVP